MGAIVASLLAGRKKQVDLERINKQLREINDHLMHRQAPEVRLTVMPSRPVSDTPPFAPPSCLCFCRVYA